MTRPFIPATDCTRIEMIYGLGSLVAENVFYWRSALPLTEAQLIQVGEAAKNAWNTTIRNATSYDWQLTAIKLTGMNTDHEPVYTYSTGLPIAGAVASQSAPPNVTFCISCRTGFAGRSYRGRWYWIGVPLNVIYSGGYVSLATAESMRSKLAAFQTELTWGPNPVDGQHVICSFRRNKEWRSVAEVNNVTSYVAVDANLDSMRRRLPGRGRT